jgi:hypothetical protein
LNLQAVYSLRCFDVGRKISFLEYLAIFGFEQGKARTCFGENEDTHFELRLLVALPEVLVVQSFSSRSFAKKSSRVEGAIGSLLELALDRLSADSHHVGFRPGLEP